MANDLKIMQIRFFLHFGLFLSFLCMYVCCIPFFMICILGFTFPFNKILAYLMLATPNFVNIAIKNKIRKILKKNPGFEKIHQFGSVLIWEKVQGLKKDPNVIVNFSCAPIMSMDRKGAFSTFKDFLSSNRNCLTEAHLKDQILIQWNQVLLQ